MRHNNLTCENCPFARSLGNGRYVCSAENLETSSTVVYAHFQGDKNCWEELERAKNKEVEYETHLLNDKTTKLGKALRAEVSPNALDWFERWRERAENPREVQQEAQGEFDNFLFAQSEVTSSQQFAEQNNLKLEIRHDVLSPEILVWDDSYLHGKLICRAKVFQKTQKWRATRNRWKTSTKADSLVSAIAPLVKKFRREQEPLNVGI